MISSAMRGARRGFWLLAGGIILAGVAHAQDIDEGVQPRGPLPAGAVVQSLDNGPGAELRRNLTTLAENPQSVDALIGAGRASLDAGDGAAALGFFQRAQEIAPSDARVKAGLASAMVLSQRPETALVTFADAARLGASDAELGRDRGLAYDMVGDPRHAQQDYTAYLRRHPEDGEVQRRLALSLAISGQRDAALRVIDAQLRRHDRAAWRTQAFVLALTGDSAGAEDTARRMMPPANAEAMAPFFARLPGLNPAQRAAAVHFGRIPADGRAVQMASRADPSADPGALALARGGPEQPVQPAPVQTQIAAVRRRPDLGDRPVNTLIRSQERDLAPAAEPARTQLAQAPVRRFEPPRPEPSEDDQDSAADDRQEVLAQSQPYQGPRPREAPAFVPNGNFTLDTSRQQATPPPPQQQAPVSQSPTPGFELQQQAPPVRQTFTPPVRQTPVIQPTRPAFSDVASLVRSLPQEDGAAAAQPARTEPDRRSRDAAARAVEQHYRTGSTPSASRTARPPSGRADARSARGSAARDRDDEDSPRSRRSGRNQAGNSRGGSDSASSRSGRSRADADDDRSSRNRTASRRRSRDEDSRSARSSSRDRTDAHGSRTARGRATSAHDDDDSRSSRGRASAHDRRDDNASSRASRSRSGQEQRPAARGRRAH